MFIRDTVLFLDVIPRSGPSSQTCNIAFILENLSGSKTKHMGAMPRSQKGCGHVWWVQSSGNGVLTTTGGGTTRLTWTSIAGAEDRGELLL
jgi:hypothetical protein